MNATTLTSCTLALLVAAAPAFAARKSSSGPSRGHRSSGHGGKASHGAQRSGGHGGSSHVSRGRATQRSQPSRASRNDRAHGVQGRSADRISRHRGESGHSSYQRHGHRSGLSLIFGFGGHRHGYGGYGSGYRYGYGYGGYGYPAYRSYGHHDDQGALRILARPNTARVIVDGYYAGIADDFDGLLQRLHVAPGRHEIQLELEGYQNARFDVYTPLGHTIKLHHQMVPGRMGVAGGVPYSDDDQGYEESEPMDDASWPQEDLRSRGDAASLVLEVSPSDASVYVDGQLVGRAAELSTLPLASGTHTIEVVRPGYRPQSRRVGLRPGEATRLRLDLER